MNDYFFMAIAVAALVLVGRVLNRGGAALIARQWSAKERHQVFTALADSFQGNLVGNDLLLARYGGLQWSVRVIADPLPHSHDVRNFTVFMVEAYQALPPELSFRPSSTPGLFDPNDLKAYDADFLNEVDIEPMGPELFAWLDAATRRTIRDLVGAGFSLEAMHLRRRVRGIHIELEELSAAFEGILSLTQHFEDLPPVPELLARQAAQETIPGVRLRCLELLVSHFKGEPQTQAALERARQDDHPEIVNFAAQQ